MTLLNMTVNVPDVDITLIDPEDSASEMIDLYNEYLRVNGLSDTQVDLISAEWDQ